MREPWSAWHPGRARRSAQKPCRPCENAIQHLRDRTFFLTNAARQAGLASKLSKAPFFRRAFCFCSESVSFQTVCMVYAQRSAPKISREYAVQNTRAKG